MAKNKLTIDWLFRFQKHLFLNIVAIAFHTDEELNCAYFDLCSTQDEIITECDNSKFT